MAKKVIGFIKLHVPGGQANPAPPVGPALGQHGVNIMEFCKQFNAKTQSQQGVITPVEITSGPFTDFSGTVQEVYRDKGKVKVEVSLFGRPTSVELDFTQLKGY